MTTYTLKSGTYLVGDPALIFKKNESGTKVTRKLWDTFYQDMNAFQHLDIEGIDLFITRTAEGDGFYQGVGTDTGTIMIIRIDAYLEDERLNVITHRSGMLTLAIHEGETITVDRFNIYFSNGVQIITQSDDI